MPEPLDDYLHALRSAADVYPTDVIGSRIAAVSATISFLRASNVDSRLITPLLAVLGHLEDRRHSRTGNFKPVMDSVNMAAMAAVITLARRAGQPLTAAAEMVAKNTGIGAHYPQSVRQLLQFRKNLMDKRESREARRMYEVVIIEAGKAGLSPQDALVKGLEFLRDKMVATSTFKHRPDRLSN
jgi:hypothetical protein